MKRLTTITLAILMFCIAAATASALDAAELDALDAQIQAEMDSLATEIAVDPETTDEQFLDMQQYAGEYTSDFQYDPNEDPRGMSQARDAKTEEKGLQDKVDEQNKQGATTQEAAGTNWTLIIGAAAILLALGGAFAGRKKIGGALSGAAGKIKGLRKIREFSEKDALVEANRRNMQNLKAHFNQDERSRVLNSTLRENLHMAEVLRKHFPDDFLAVKKKLVHENFMARKKDIELDFPEVKKLEDFFLKLQASAIKSKKTASLNADFTQECEQMAIETLKDLPKPAIERAENTIKDLYKIIISDTKKTREKEKSVKAADTEAKRTYRKMTEVLDKEALNVLGQMSSVKTIKEGVRNNADVDKLSKQLEAYEQAVLDLYDLMREERLLMLQIAPPARKQVQQIKQAQEEQLKKAA